MDTDSMMTIAIGYDPSETVAYHTLVQSILERCSMPVRIIPISRRLLLNYEWRDRDPRQSNDFAFLRFLAPHLCGYEGWVLWMDCDMLFRDDPAKLWALRDDRFAVMCCRHDYTPSTSRKFLGQQQTAYRRKNWSSVMLLNCDHHSTKRLTPHYVNTASGLDLHRMTWCEPEEIGDLPLEWNWLVGEYPYNPNAKNVHFTIAGPWHVATKCKMPWRPDYSDEWENVHERVNFADRTTVDLTQ